MKGQSIEFYFSVFLYMASIVSLLLMVIAHYQRIITDTNTIENSLKSVDVAHLAKDCFSMKGVVYKALLTDEKAKKCGIGSYYIRIKELGGDFMWQHGNYGDGYEHKIFVSIETDKGAAPAEIYVKV